MIRERWRAMEEGVLFCALVWYVCRTLTIPLDQQRALALVDAFELPTLQASKPICAAIITFSHLDLKPNPFMSTLLRILDPSRENSSQHTARRMNKYIINELSPSKAKNDDTHNLRHD